MAQNEPERDSLVPRLIAAAQMRLSALRQPAGQGPREWQVGAAVALLIAAGPVATIAGAGLLARATRAETLRLQTEATPRVAAQQAAARDRIELGAVLRRPTLGATLEALARALPAEAVLLRAQRDRHGLLEVEVAAPDPDQLRAALRREPMLAALRDAGQRQGEAAMIVSLKEPGE